jgi:hypothetical protein
LARLDPLVPAHHLASTLRSCDRPRLIISVPLSEA